jgi:hypothetical protein
MNKNIKKIVGYYMNVFLNPFKIIISNYLIAIFFTRNQKECIKNIINFNLYL